MILPPCFLTLAAVFLESETLMYGNHDGGPGICAGLVKMPPTG